MALHIPLPPSALPREPDGTATLLLSSGILTGMAFVYILRCGDGSYYVGSARSLHRRVDAHMMGKGAAYTSRRLPVTLLWYQEFDSIADAFWWEKRIQNWSRAKREALMRGDYVALRAASKKIFRKPDEDLGGSADPDC